MGAYAAAVCMNGDGQLLMVLQGKRDEEKTWSVPSGGKEDHESFEECCIREVWEETGYIIKVNELIHTKANAQIRYFAAELIGGEAAIHDPDHLIYEIAWKSLEDLKQLTMTYEEDRHFLIQYLSHSRKADAGC